MALKASGQRPNELEKISSNRFDKNEEQLWTCKGQLVNPRLHLLLLLTERKMSQQIFQQTSKPQS